MLIARQYAAQGMWDVTSLQHSNDIGPGPGARNVQETVEKVMHVRKFCEHVSRHHTSCLSTSKLLTDVVSKSDPETLESIFVGKMRYHALLALVQLEFRFQTLVAPEFIEASAKLPSP